MSGSWRTEDVDGVTLIRCELLLGVPGLAHAFSTRRADGRDDLDMGGIAPAGRELEERRSRFLRAAGLAHLRPFLVKQVHGSRIVRAKTDPVPEEADGIVWLREDAPAAVPSVRCADCVPILLVDRAGRGAVAVHAGWRGTAAGIAGRAIEALGRIGVAPEEILAALGPAILPCCYEVGCEVAQAVAGAPGNAGGSLRLDLHDANRRQILHAGVRPAAIEAAPWCTRCRGDLFFSHRREGGGTGRMMASVGLARP